MSDIGARYRLQLPSISDKGAETEQKYRSSRTRRTALSGSFMMKGTRNPEFSECDRSFDYASLGNMLKPITDCPTVRLSHAHAQGDKISPVTKPGF